MVSRGPNKNSRIVIEIIRKMIALLSPILMRFVTSRQVKKLIVDLLEALAAKSENKLDDLAVKAVREALLPED